MECVWMRRAFAVPLVSSHEAPEEISLIILSSWHLRANDYSLGQGQGERGHGPLSSQRTGLIEAISLSELTP